jgi:putative membrane protein
MHVDGWGALIIMALLLGFMNAFIRPVLLLLSVPFILVTLGFFILVVNALTFWFAGAIVPGFHVGGFWPAFFGSIIVSVVNWVMSIFVRSHDGEYRVITRQGEMKQVQGRVVE